MSGKRKRSSDLDDLSDIMAHDAEEALEDLVPKEKQHKGKPEKRRKAQPDIEPPPRRARAMPDPPPREEKQNTTLSRRETIIRIESWVDAFKKTLEPLAEKKELESMNLEELTDFLEECKYTVGMTQSSQMTAWIPATALAITEDVLTNFTPVKAQGLVGLGEDMQFRQACMELQLELTTMKYIPPEYRIGFMVLNTIYRLDERARNLAPQAEAPKNGMDKELDEAMGSYKPPDKEKI